MEKRHTGAFLDSIPLDTWQHTPWGSADFVNAFATGVCFVATPSHGGYWLSAERNMFVHPLLRSTSFYHPGPNGSGWYEEDCEWASVALTYPELFPAKALLHAIAIKINYAKLTTEQLRDILQGVNR